MTYVGHQIRLDECGEGSDLQTICEDGTWSARVRQLHVDEAKGISERGAVRALAEQFRAIARRLDEAAQDLR